MDSGDSDGLSTEVIASIVIGCVIAAALVIFFCWWLQNLGTRHLRKAGMMQHKSI